MVTTHISEPVPSPVSRVAHQLAAVPKSDRFQTVVLLAVTGGVVSQSPWALAGTVAVVLAAYKLGARR